MDSGEHHSLDTGPEMTCQRIDLGFSPFGKGSELLALDLKSGEYRITKCPALVPRPAEAVLMRGTHDGLISGDRDRNHVISPAGEIMVQGNSITNYPGEDNIWPIQTMKLPPTTSAANWKD